MSLWTEIIQPALQSDLQDELEKNYTKEEGIHYLNEIHFRIVQELAQLEEDLGLTSLTPVAIAEDDTSVTLQSDFLAPGWFYLSGKTYPIDIKTYGYKDLLLKQQAASPSTGEPRWGAIKGTTFILWPIADDSYSLCGEVYLKPALWTDAEADSVPFNGIFNHLYKHFFTLRCLNRDEASFDWEGQWLDVLRRGILNALKHRKPRRFATPFRKQSDETVTFIQHTYE